MEQEVVREWARELRPMVEEFLSFIDPSEVEFLEFLFGSTEEPGHTIEQAAERFEISVEEVETRRKHLLRAMISRLNQESTPKE